MKVSYVVNKDGTKNYKRRQVVPDSPEVKAERERKRLEAQTKAKIPQHSSFDSVKSGGMVLAFAAPRNCELEDFKIVIGTLAPDSVHLQLEREDGSYQALPIKQGLNELKLKIQLKPGEYLKGKIVPTAAAEPIFSCLDVLTSFTYKEA